MGVVHSSVGHMKPSSSNLLSEPAIVAGIASAVESKSSFSALDWGNWSKIMIVRDLIEATIPGLRIIIHVFETNQDSICLIRQGMT